MWIIPFWVIPRRLSSNCRRFGTHYRFHLHRQVNEVSFFIHLPMKMEPIVSSETSAIRTQTPGNYPKRNKLHLEHGESLKTRIFTSKFVGTGPSSYEKRIYRTAVSQRFRNTGPEESYRMCCVVVCDLETSWMRRPWSTGVLSRQKQTNKPIVTIASSF